MPLGYRPQGGLTVDGKTCDAPNSPIKHSTSFAGAASKKFRLVQVIPTKIVSLADPLARLNSGSTAVYASQASLPDKRVGQSSRQVSRRKLKAFQFKLRTFQQNPTAGTV